MGRENHRRVITPDMSVRQVVLACPQSADVLETIDGSRVAGRWSLQSLGALARQAGLDVEVLLELLAAAGVEVDPHGTRDDADRAAPIRPIFAALLIGITVGTGWGVSLLLRVATGATYAAAPAASVHAHGVAQLWGWMALFIFAIATHLLRLNTRHAPPTWIGRASFVLVVAGVAMFFAAGFGNVAAWFPLVYVAGSAMLGTATVLYAISTTWSIFGRGQPPLAWHMFVLSATAWLLIWAAGDFYLRIKYLHVAVPPDAARAWLIAVPVLGFATNAIYGFGIRLLPGLMNLRNLSIGAYDYVGGFYNSGLLLLLIGTRDTSIMGAALMLVSAIIYLYALGWLRGQPSRPIFGVDLRGGFFVRLAFAWLVVGLTMILAQSVWPALNRHEFGGAWRHALTVGFISTMMLSVGHRLIPILLRQPLASNRLMLVSLSLIAIGNALRVGLELLTMTGQRWTFRLMGASGVMELTSIVIFALNLLLTVRNRKRGLGRQAAIEPGTRVQEAIDREPAIQLRLSELGITMFDSVPFVAPSMTFGALALAEKWEPGELVRRIGQAQNSN